MSTKTVELWNNNPPVKLATFPLDLFCEELKSFIFMHFGRKGYKSLYLVYP